MRKRNERESIIGNGFPLARSANESAAVNVSRINEASLKATRLLGLPDDQQLKVLARLFNLEVK